MNADAYVKRERGPRVDALSPAEIQAKVETLGVVKTKMPFVSVALLSVMAGIGIALGGMFFCVVLGDPTLGFAAKKLVGGLAFCLGLTLVVVGGAELFTGNCMIVMAWANKQISALAVLKNWSVVWVGNLIGSLIIVALLFAAHYADGNHGAIGNAIVKVGAAKISGDVLTLFCKGVMCNLLVCLAVWLTYAGRSVADKVAGLVLPITAFVAAGFEHCVANMFFLPMAWVLVHTGHVPAGVDVSMITVGGILHNLIPVTIGNIVGGVALALIYWRIYRKSLGGLTALAEPGE